MGGSNPMGGAGGGGGGGASAGLSGVANTGGGGGGGGSTSFASGSGGGAGGYTVAQITSPLATYTYTIGAGGTAGAAGTSGFAGGAGGSGYIEVTEYYGNNMPLLVGGVTSNTSGMERVERARITGGSDSTDCTSSPCTITRQSGAWLSSVTRSGTGGYTLNFATGMFSSIPECTCSAETGSSYGLCVYRPSTSSSGTILTASNGTTPTDMRFSVICMGPR
jgi:hypothetical protein